MRFKMSEWIDLQDEQPIEMKAVLTIGKTPDGNWTTPITANLYNGKFIVGFNFGFDRVCKVMVETKPTHWMPLPEPPK